MILTKKKAIKITIELWGWLAKTGSEYKEEWSGWEKYGEMQSDCAFCEYDMRTGKDDYAICPLTESRNNCCEYSYDGWISARNNETRKKYAKLFLEELRKI